MEYILENGNIVCDGVAYPIIKVVASYGYDMPNIEGVVRMTRLEIESDVSAEINNKVTNCCFNELCEEEFVVEDECWDENAKKSIKECLCVDYDIINIEFQ